MNLRNLTIASMIIATQQWLDPKGLLPLLEAHESLRVFVPKLRKLLEDLLRLRPLQDTLDKLLKDVGIDARAIDRRHDTKAKALFLALESLVLGLGEDDAVLSEACKQLQQTLFPQELKTLQLSFLEEVGEAMRAAEQLSEAQRELLRKLAWGPQGQTLWDLFNAWQAAAADLNTLEARREALQSQRAHMVSDGVSKAQIQSTRQLWGRTARTLLASIELEDELSALQRDQLTARLSRLAEAADKEAPEVQPPTAGPDTATDQGTEAN